MQVSLAAQVFRVASVFAGEPGCGVCFLEFDKLAALQSDPATLQHHGCDCRDALSWCCDVPLRASKQVGAGRRGVAAYSTSVVLCSTVGCYADR